MGRHAVAVAQGDDGLGAVQGGLVAAEGAGSDAAGGVAGEAIAVGQ